MSEEGFSVNECPTCGSRRIKKVAGKWSGKYEGKPYQVSAVEYYACPDCGELVYPPEAMRRIQHASPAYSRRPARTAS